MFNAVKLNKEKLFAVINADNYIIDCWCAGSLEEAQTDNPEFIVIEVTLKNSPFTIGEKYIAKE